MEINKINGPLLKEIFKGAVNYLISRKEEVNALNVFPVPDGDTGTNMSLTSKSALKQIESLEEILLLEMFQLLQLVVLLWELGVTVVLFFHNFLEVSQKA